MFAWPSDMCVCDAKPLEVTASVGRVGLHQSRSDGVILTLVLHKELLDVFAG